MEFWSSISTEITVFFLVLHLSLNLGQVRPLVFFSTDAHYEGVITIMNVLEIDKRKVSKGFRSLLAWTKVLAN